MPKKRLEFRLWKSLYVIDSLKTLLIKVIGKNLVRNQKKEEKKKGHNLK